MKETLKGILMLILVFALVVFIETRICMIYGLSKPDPLSAIFRIYFPN